jgi:predicted O-methyltransferase YrrM
MGKKRRLKVGGEPFVYSAELPPSEETEIWKRLDLQPNPRIREIYKDGIVQIGKEKIKLTSAISPAEGFHLYDLIKSNKYKNILEIGMANGMSGMYMAQALQENGEGHLTSIDPFQEKQWKSAGLHNIEKAGLDEYHTLVQKKSYEAMPELLAEGKKYDLIFIDGMHLFDYTLVDMFYAILLCRVGGAIVVDDILHKGPAKVIKYAESNYKQCLRRIYQSPVKTMATYVKNSEDNRAWDYHQSF